MFRVRLVIGDGLQRCQSDAVLCKISDTGKQCMYNLRETIPMFFTKRVGPNETDTYMGTYDEEMEMDKEDKKNEEEEELS